MDELQELLAKAEKLFNEKKFKEVIELLPENVLEKHKSAELYTWRGWVHDRLRETQDIIVFVEKAISVKPNYGAAYRVKGNYFRSKKEYNEALKNYYKAIELNPKDEIAHNNIGVIFSDKLELDSALRCYNKAIQINPAFALPYRNIGDIYHKLKEYEKALISYNKAIELDSEEFDWLTIHRDKLKEQIEGDARLKQKLQRDAFFEKIKAIERLIEEHTNKIREYAKSNENLVVHYTKLSVGDKLVKGDSGKLWYSNAIYMNDPDEGKILFKYFNDNAIEDSFNTGARSNESSVYLGSFLPATVSESLSTHEDELVMWRTYGKDEDKIEAAGCSLVLAATFFDKDGETIVSETDSNKEEVGIKAHDSGQSLLKVIYLKNKKIEEDNNGHIETELSALKTQLYELLKLKGQADKDAQSEIDRIVFKHLSKICYLFKSSDYSFEKEVRVIVYVPLGSEVIKHVPQELPNAPKRFYIESTRSILPHLRKIYLGSKVQNHAQWSYYLDYELRQKAKTDSTIKPGDIEILKSTCNFQ